jgi:hypothetical protein
MLQRRQKEVETGSIAVEYPSSTRRDPAARPDERWSYDRLDRLKGREDRIVCMPLNERGSDRHTRLDVLRN